MSHSQEILQILKKVKDVKPIPQMEPPKCKVETFSFDDIVTEKKVSHPEDYNLDILRSLLTSINQNPLSTQPRAWKIMHPYARHLG